MWEMNLLALLALLIYSASVNAIPTISRVSPSLFVPSGGAVSMDCEVLHATEYPVLWVKLPRKGVEDMPTPLTSGSALIVRDDRFR